MFGVNSEMHLEGLNILISQIVWCSFVVDALHGFRFKSYCLLKFKKNSSKEHFKFTIKQIRHNIDVYLLCFYLLR